MIGAKLLELNQATICQMVQEHMNSTVILSPLTVTNVDVEYQNSSGYKFFAIIEPCNNPETIKETQCPNPSTSS